MSSDAIGWTLRHSPYNGSTLLVHLAAADSANDQNDNELWMSVTRLATKARVYRTTASTAVTTLLDDGFLEVLVDHRHDKAGKPSRYRFLFPDVPVVYESRTPPGVSSQTTGGVARDDTNPREPNPVPTSSSSDVQDPGARDDDDQGLSDGDRIRAAFELILDQRAEGQTIRNPSGWRSTVRTQVREQHAERANVLAVEHPDWTPAALAAALEPPEHRPDPTADVQAARRREHERNAEAMAEDRDVASSEDQLAELRRIRQEHRDRRKARA